MKELNQIILCSTIEGRSFLRGVMVLEDYAVVTHVERLPFRYHEILLDKRRKKERDEEITVPVWRGSLHKGCAFCGNGSTFQCGHCGFYSCMKIGAGEHYCLGCKKTRKTKPVKTSHASNSGFVGNALLGDTPGSWDRAQSALLGLIQHRNRHAG